MLGNITTAMSLKLTTLEFAFQRCFGQAVITTGAIGASIQMYGLLFLNNSIKDGFCLSFFRIEDPSIAIFDRNVHVVKGRTASIDQTLYLAIQAKTKHGISRRRVALVAVRNKPAMRFFLDTSRALC